MCSSYPEFVLTNIICIENTLKGTEIMFLLNMNFDYTNTVHKHIPIAVLVTTVNSRYNEIPAYNRVLYIPQTYKYYSAYNELN